MVSSQPQAPAEPQVEQPPEQLGPVVPPPSSLQAEASSGWLPPPGAHPSSCASSWVQGFHSHGVKGEGDKPEKRSSVRSD